MLGIVLSTSYTLPDHTIYLFASAICILAFILYFAARYLTAIICCISLFFIAGLHQGAVSSRLPQSPDHIYNHIVKENDVVITGRLAEMVAFDGTTSQARIQLKAIRFPTDKVFTSARGTILLRMRHPWPTSFLPGDLLAIRAILKRPAGFQTPGIFDYTGYLARKNIWITGYVRSPAQLYKISSPDTHIDRLRYFPENIRNQIGRFIDKTTPRHLTGMYRAILLGDRSRLPESTLESFKASGTMHILAISGLHVSLIASLLYITLYWLLRRSEWLVLHLNLRKTAGVLSLPFIFGYCFLAGLNSPVLRACIMSCIVILAFCANRPKTFSALLAAAALLILTISPQALFTASFQLSFAAVFAIILCTPLLVKLLGPIAGPAGYSQSFPGRCLRWLIAALLASSTAVLGTAPIVIFHFNRFPLVGPLANVFLEPLICLWALPFSFMALPCIYFFPLGAKTLFLIAAGGLTPALAIADFFSSPDWSTLWLPPPQSPLVISYYAAFAFVMFTLAYSRKLVAPAIILFSFILVVLLTPDLRFSQHVQKGFSATYIDIGQGSATLLSFPGNHHVFIDAGGSAFAKESIGQRIVAPFLWSLGIYRLDGLIVTHPDADHYNGMDFLIQHFSPTFLWTSTLKHQDEPYRKMIVLARKYGVEVSQARSGDSIRFGDISINCLVNTGKESKLFNNDNAGLIIQVTTKQHTLLFPGDISKVIESWLLEQQLELKSDILLAAHHGSATSNSKRLMQAVRPQTLVVSAGRSRAHIFPSKGLVEYCRDNYIPLLVTAKNGTITVYEEGDRLEVLEYSGLQGNPLRRSKMMLIPTQEKPSQ